MDKLELDLNDLKVDSFQANPQQEEEKGTIRGNGESGDRCVGIDTDASCNACPTVVTEGYWGYCETDERCDQSKEACVTGWVEGC